MRTSRKGRFYFSIISITTRNPVVIDGHAIMNQFWRLPLELGLLAGMVYLLWKPAARAVAPRLVPVPSPVRER